MKFAEDRIEEVLNEMNSALVDRHWLSGENLSLADISIAPFIERLETNGLENLIDWELRPYLRSWWSRIQELQSYKIAFSFPEN